MRIDGEDEFSRILPQCCAADAVALIKDPQRQRFRLGIFGDGEIAGYRPPAGTGDFQVVNQAVIALPDEFFLQHFKWNGGERPLLSVPIRVEILRLRLSGFQGICGHTAAQTVLDGTAAALGGSSVGGEQRGFDHCKTGPGKFPGHDGSSGLVELPAERFASAVVTRADDLKEAGSRFAVSGEPEGEFHLLTGPVFGIGPVDGTGEPVAAAVGRNIFDDPDIAEPGRPGNLLQREFDPRGTDIGGDCHSDRVRRPRPGSRKISGLRVVDFAVGIVQDQHQLHAVPVVGFGRNVLLFDFGGEHHFFSGDPFHRNRNGRRAAAARFRQRHAPLSGRSGIGGEQYRFGRQRRGGQQDKQQRQHFHFRSPFFLKASSRTRLRSVSRAGTG